MKGLALLGVVLAVNAATRANEPKEERKQPVAPVEAPAKAPDSPASTEHPAPAPQLNKPLYTTYFYTAGEAVVHGYEADTKVRIVSMEKRGTIWEGSIGVGETRTVQTGRGVFGFLADKKATILVGTPSSCAVVGYFAKDETGSFRSERFFMQVPSAMNFGSERVVVWAYEPATVELSVRKTEKVLKKAELKANEFLVLDGEALRGVLGQVVQVKSTGSKVAVEAYFDQGFMVPADNGRGSGKHFLTFVGSLTNGSNDLLVLAQGLDANVTVRDLGKQGKDGVLFSGKVPKGGLKALNMVNKYVDVQSDVPVNVVVALNESAGYAEHHFQTGLEGSGIENDFLVTTSGELWLFSYFKDNDVTVTNAKTGQQLFTGVLGPGGVRGLTPGTGLYKVKSSKGMSVMGGASSCGADYSPAGSMFAVDEAMFTVIAQVQEERVRAAAASGKKLDAAALAAPLSKEEWDRNAPKAAPAGYRMSLDEANERAAQIQQQH